MHVVVFVTQRDPLLEQTATAAHHTLDGMAGAVVARDMIRERHLVLDRLRRMGVLCLDVPPGQLTPRLISTYVMIKAREMI